MASLQSRGICQGAYRRLPGHPLCRDALQVRLQRSVRRAYNSTARARVLLVIPPAPPGLKLAILRPLLSV